MPGQGLNYIDFTKGNDIKQIVVQIYTYIIVLQ